MVRTCLTALLCACLLLAGPALGFKRAQVGEPAQDFQLETLGGEPLRLSESLGSKATLVLFWTTWNPRSLEALADLQKLYAERKGDGLAVIAVNVEHQDLGAEDLAKIAKVVEELELAYPVVVDRGLATYNDYGVVAVPSLVLADAGGSILELVQGYATGTRREFPDRVLVALGLESERPKATTAALPPAEGKAYRYLKMGELFVKRGMNARAEKSFRMAIEEDPGHVGAHEALAAVLEEEGKDAEAAEIRQKISAMAGK